MSSLQGALLLHGCEALEIDGMNIVLAKFSKPCSFHSHFILHPCTDTGTISNYSRRMSSPFPNIYQLRRVGTDSAKPCAVCYKSTQAVLVSAPDFIYVCESHLKDKQFCTVKYADGEDGKDAEYQSLDKEVRSLDLKTAQIQHKIQQRESQLAKVRDYLWKPKDGENQPDLKQQLAEIIKRRDQARAKLEKIIKAYTRYTLDAVFYKTRLQQHSKKIRQQQIMQKLNDGTLFPSIPDLPKP
ncbi:hypothetical protein KL931_002194 [Ogataea haglerorum]|nr:hypothetical protein KL931_002194 [Ogataea haglerorum]